MTDYTLIRTNRKTMALYIRPDGLEVRAPKHTPLSEIEALVASKQDWITTHLAKQREQAAAREHFTLDYGDQVTFLGRDYPIAAKEGDRIGFDGESFYMPPHLGPAEIKQACVQIYRMLAKSHIPRQVTQYAAQMSLSPTAVRITSAKTRWGSCSAKGSLNFSWRLIMADEDLVDYVVVHELAHLLEMNHSARFWEIVEKTLPDYKQRRARLNELQQRLSREDWD